MHSSGVYSSLISVSNNNNNKTTTPSNPSQANTQTQVYIRETSSSTCLYTDEILPFFRTPLIPPLPALLQLLLVTRDPAPILTAPGLSWMEGEIYNYWFLNSLLSKGNRNIKIHEYWLLNFQLIFHNLCTFHWFIAITALLM